MASLAEVPGRIESLFNVKVVNSAGIYSVNFYVNGQRKEVIIDDYVPCDPKNKMPSFAYSADMGEIWAMLLEKAWAKLHGSYCMIRKGSTISAMPHLTGAASSTIDHNFINDSDSLWTRLNDAVERKYAVTCSTQETDLPSLSRRHGIISGHSYSILATHRFKHKSAKVRLVKLRNPQGTNEWQGDWSDKSDKWTPKIRADLGA